MGLKRSESITNLAAALVKFQKEVVSPKNNANNPYFSSKYAPLHEVINVIREPLAKYGLSYIQSTSTDEQNVTVTTLLMHESGEFVESEPLSLPGLQVLKGGGKDFTPQGIGSAITYGRRYSLTAILGIASEDDTDGNEGTPDPRNNPSKGKNQGTGAQTGTGGVKKTIEAKYKLLHDNSLDGLTDFIKEHGANAEQVLTQMLMDR
ncbi:ERF family protein [Paenibacillus alvei]|uniref:ERF family protein n=1 Tax=Paenibacillus alvei TaxID=44250 RepID=A0ABT4H6I5_PAEAL|nr:ERF family protein [Paenibacillus alvei]EJW14416.1 ERF family protein [Paenibacillus alvei DSM 29]MCY9539190.1 ERF family protein [Paenibacillus alvei]MCY9708707.1 ERF family protein [Paenibacillus alvei]MCY9737287.1 ERF family protein [Paenibacillus alvei]MCY9758133.1 ERF family protein [Paenibacillus alvei]